MLNFFLKLVRLQSNSSFDQELKSVFTVLIKDSDHLREATQMLKNGYIPTPLQYLTCLHNLRSTCSNSTNEYSQEEINQYVCALARAITRGYEKKVKYQFDSAYSEMVKLESIFQIPFWCSDDTRLAKTSTAVLIEAVRNYCKIKQEYYDCHNEKLAQAIEEAFSTHIKKIEAHMSHSLNSYNAQLKNRNFAQLSLTQFAQPQELKNNRVVMRCLEIRQEIAELLQASCTVMTLEHKVYLEKVLDKELPQLAHNALTISGEVASDYASKTGTVLEDSILSIVDKYSISIAEIKKLYLEQQSQALNAQLRSTHLYLDAKIDELKGSCAPSEPKALKVSR